MNDQLCDLQQDLLSVSAETDKVCEERLTSPQKARDIHQQYEHDDLDSSANRALVQDMKDYVPPFDPKEIMGTDRFNVNFGSGTAYINEAVASLIDIITSSVNLVDLKLSKEIPDEVRRSWEGILSEEATTTIREWDAWFPTMLSVIDTCVTHGVSIPFFDDAKDPRFNAGSLEEFKFPAEAEANPSSPHVVTSKRYMDVDALYRKIDGKADTNGRLNGWSAAKVMEAIKQYNPTKFDETNPEEVQRTIKANRAWASSCLQKVELIYVLVREMDGSISLYATTAKAYDTDNEGKEEWLYCERDAFKDPGQIFQFFTYSIGNKNKIHSIRGLGYMIYEACNADNILRNKMMDIARINSSQIFKPASVEAAQNATIVDMGFGIMLPPGINIEDGKVTKGIDNNILAAINSNRELMQQHTGGLASNPNQLDPSSRRNQLESAAAMEQMTKMQVFAINLFYPAFDRLMREISRRLFQVTQSDATVVDMVVRMKRRCIDRGVDPVAFDQIEIQRSKSCRLIGTGSKASRLGIFGRLISELYPTYDAAGQEALVRDYTVELTGVELADRYKPAPTERKPHQDVQIANLENTLLMQGNEIPPVDGENKMVHLHVHSEALKKDIEGLDTGEVNLVDWVLDRQFLYDHFVDTLETTTVQESQIGQLNQMRQLGQQIGEIMNNGYRHIEKLKRQGVDVEAMRNGEPQPGQEGQPGQGAAPKAELDARTQERILASKIRINEQDAEAKRAIKMQDAQVDIAIKDAKAAADIKRDRIKR